MCTVAGPCDPVVWVFSTSGFHRFLATKPVSSETNKQNGGQCGDHSSIWDSWPIAFSGYPRGPRVVLRLGARGTQRLTNRLRLALEPECLENPTATAREIPRDGADSIRDTQAVCGFRCWPRSTLLSSTPSTRWWQSSWPRSDAPSPAGGPWSAKRCRTLETDRVLLEATIAAPLNRFFRS